MMLKAIPCLRLDPQTTAHTYNGLVRYCGFLDNSGNCGNDIAIITIWTNSVYVCPHVYITPNNGRYNNSGLINFIFRIEFMILYKYKHIYECSYGYKYKLRNVDNKDHNYWTKHSEYYQLV